MDLGLAGKVVIVTGATANIGRGIALDFAAEGAKLVAVGRDEEAGARVVADARTRGAQDAIFVARRPARSGFAARRSSTRRRSWGRSTCWSTMSAAMSAQGLFVDTDPATWQGDIDITFLTVLRMTHAVLPGMIERKRGRIINIGSTLGTRRRLYAAGLFGGEGRGPRFHPRARQGSRQAQYHRQLRRALRHHRRGSGRLQQGQPLPPRDRLHVHRVPRQDPDDWPNADAPACCRGRWPRRRMCRRRCSIWRRNEPGFITGQVMTVDGGTLL